MAMTPTMFPMMGVTAWKSCDTRTTATHPTIACVPTFESHEPAALGVSALRKSTSTSSAEVATPVA